MQENQLHTSETPGLGRLFLKATGLALLFATIMLLVTAGVAGLVVYRKLHTFSTTAGISLTELYTTVKGQWNQPPSLQDNGHTTFLVLGVDTVEGRGSVPPLTDTLMLVSLDYGAQKVNILSLPRDIWSEAYKTKINALYAYGQKRYPESPERFPTEVLAELTGVPIHYTLVVNMDMVAEVIDILGGVSVTVPESFTDPLFPIPGVDVTTERDPKKLYMEVHFDAGEQVLSGERALIFMRSRHSSGDTGTDTDRAKRQYLVLEALSQRLSQREVITDPILMGKLFAFYKNTVGKKLPLDESVRIGSTLLHSKKAPQFEHEQLPASSTDPKSLLYNPPPRTRQNQWVYLIQNPSQFREYVQKALYE